MTFTFLSAEGKTHLVTLPATFFSLSDDVLLSPRLRRQKPLKTRYQISAKGNTAQLDFPRIYSSKFSLGLIVGQINLALGQLSYFTGQIDGGVSHNKKHVMVMM